MINGEGAYEGIVVIKVFPLNSNNFGGVKNIENTQYKMLVPEGTNERKVS